MLLDLVEVPRSHSGVNLAEAFANVLKDFGIEDKVSFNVSINCIETKTYFITSDPQRYLR
jgi:hypothetical protein